MSRPYFPPPLPPPHTASLAQQALLHEIATETLERWQAAELAGVDVPQAMGWRQTIQLQQKEGLAGAAAAVAAAAAGEPEALEDEDVEAAKGADGSSAAAAANDEEIALPGEEGEGGGAEDAELLALALEVPGGGAAAATAAERRVADAAQRAERGEPRSWEEMSDGEQEGA